jgi:hypothetical protein
LVVRFDENHRHPVEGRSACGLIGFVTRWVSISNPYYFARAFDGKRQRVCGCRHCAPTIIDDLDGNNGNVRPILWRGWLIQSQLKSRSSPCGFQVILEDGHSLGGASLQRAWLIRNRPLQDAI